MVMMTHPVAGQPPAPGLRVLIVGGGASGVLLAAQLLRQGQGQVAVTILERGAMLGCGVAYSTPDPQHLLNTRVANMSAYPDQPEHFLEWLRADGERFADPQGFVPRGIYGRYMQSVLDPWGETPALTCWQSECLHLEVAPRGVTAHLAGGERVEADLAVLATGHALPAAAQASGLSQPWAAPASPCDGRLLIVGSGLTMVDQVLSLLAAGQEGKIIAISRHRLLPQVHRPTEPMFFCAEDLPRPMRIASLMRWLRAQAKAREEAGGDWRDAVDGLRPHLQAIWRALPPTSRRTFLRHASAYWEVHRHRMPPASHERLAKARSDARLQLLRGQFEKAVLTPEGRLLAHIAGPDGRHRELPVSRIIDCRGVRRDPEAHATPLIAGLLASGEARVDPLRVGLDVGPDCAVLRADGSASGRLFAMGPASRAAFWEITAIPDIRSQAARLAERILNRVGSVPGPATDGEEESAPSTGRTRSKDILSTAASLEWPTPDPGR
ncbi:FAD-dependent oxidoreductase [Rubellimicrobium rubrum]|uniref:FAD-dependent oxidoreductase n=1 Tax=Rubellimicrobium rubrum TaxID=2585369 RepID=A0A5C4MVZ5_9RHOB|nr:FAD/NAD(P)-binding protein [Rubellimicrobium rubrum]TNC48551.1 FAD-dependent oxidoreductase [Rubellimicrobium rubrum]